MVTDRAGQLPLRIILVVGRTDRDEFQPLLGWLTDRVSRGHRCVTVSDLSTVRTHFSHDEFPDLIVVLQSFPDEFSQQDVQNLFTFAPLARVVVSYGAWCESDGRNHAIWPLSVRIPVWSANSRILREWQLIQTPGDQVPLPWSASREEIFAADHQCLSLGAEPQKVLIDSPDPSLRQYLVERLTASGHQVVQDQPTLMMFDVDPWGTSRTAALNELRLRHPQAEIVALANLVQPPLIADLSRCGVRTVLSQLTVVWSEATFVQS